MDLKNIISITGMSGLYVMEKERPNGIIVKSLEDEKRKFISSRQHMFTPLENITVFTEEDGIELPKVFGSMKEKEGSIPVADSKSDSEVLGSYFREVVPDYDPERVYPSDIKKIIKWYELLDENDYIRLEENKDSTASESAASKTDEDDSEAKTPDEDE